MALDASALALLLKAKTKDKVQATLPDGQVLQDSAWIDAYYDGLAEAIVEFITTGAEVQPGSMVAGGDPVTGTGTIA